MAKHLDAKILEAMTVEIGLSGSWIATRRA